MADFRSHTCENEETHQAKQNNKFELEDSGFRKYFKIKNSVPSLDSMSTAAGFGSGCQGRQRKVIRKEPARRPEVTKRGSSRRARQK